MLDLRTDGSVRALPLWTYVTKTVIHCRLLRDMSRQGHAGSASQRPHNLPPYLRTEGRRVLAVERDPASTFSVPAKLSKSA